jgi:hypothetical protein
MRYITTPHTVIKTIKTVAVLTFLAGPFATPLLAAPWTSFAGPASAGQVNYSNGSFNTGLFGSPSSAPVNNTWTWNPLIGNPGSFEAQSQDDDLDFANDFVSFNVQETGALDITTVTATLTGNYSFFGTPGGTIDVVGLLRIRYLTPTLSPAISVVSDFDEISTSLPLQTTSITGFEEGQFTGTVTLAIPSSVTSFNIRYFSALTATSEDGGTTTLGNQTLTISVPEPTSLALAGIAGTVLLKRRRNA